MSATVVALAFLIPSAPVSDTRAVPMCRCEQPATVTPGRSGIRPLNVLVGSWKGSGAPEGTKEERLAGAWEETVAWEWKFKDQDASLAVTFTKGKYFTKGELRYTPDKDAKDSAPRFTLTLTGTDNSAMTFVGGLSDKDKVLTLTRTDGPATEEQRLVFSLLHNNRHLYRFETRPANTTVAFTKKFQGWRDEGGRGVRRCGEGAGMHRQRRLGHDESELQGQGLLRLLLRLPG